MHTDYIFYQKLVQNTQKSEIHKILKISFYIYKISTMKRHEKITDF